MSQKQHDEGLDAPTPPGGPQRTDAPDGDTTPGSPAADPHPEQGSGAADEPTDEENER